MNLKSPKVYTAALVLATVCNLPEDAIAHGYDLETRYLFYNYRDNGQSDRWGGPDGGAGGFVTGDKEGRCAQWPPASYGEPHIHAPSQ